ncbi:MAG TPA: FAD binding domain-containing protein [Thermoanaerobaculia bacterium]|nr:FAD binding domain-containing protein [Thermoanaerobaculia bacterium]
MKSFERVQPRSWDDAVAALAAAREKKISSEAKGAGTELLDRLKEHNLAPDQVVDLRRLSAHSSLQKKSSGGVSIGALVTLSTIADALKSDFPALADACLGAATPQIRNAATLGGNLCQRPRCWYFRSAEFQCLKKGGVECLAKSGENEFHAVFGNNTCAIVHPSAAGVALVALNAKIETLASGGGRTIAAADFFQRPEVDIFAENSLKPGELIVEIHVDKPQGLRSAYRKIKQKQAFDWPLADAAVAWRDEGGVAKDVRIVIGSAAPVPWRAKAAEALVEGKRIDAALAARAAQAALDGATPLGKNAYKLPIVAAAVRRALLAAAGLPVDAEAES